MITLTSVMLSLGLNLAIILIVMLLWRVAMAIGDVSFVDAVWAYGMAILAGVSLLSVGGFRSGLTRSTVG